MKRFTLQWAGTGLLILAGAISLCGQTFTDISTASGMTAVRNIRPADWWVSGMLFIDLDSDGDLDWFGGSHDGRALAALNDGSGHFTAVTSGYGTSEIHVPYDINENGKIDVSMTYSDGGGQWWLNNSTPGTVSFSAQGTTWNNSRLQAMVDINKDGKVDWLIGVENQGITMEYGNGAGVFTKGSKTLSIPSPNDGVTPLPVDIDNDGDKDLVVEWGRYEYEAGRSRVYRNDGSGNFTNVTTAVGLYQDNLAILAVGDVDNDGDMDLVGLENLTLPFSIFINNGTGTFTKKSNPFTGSSGGMTYASWGLGCLTDFDNDGIADLIMGGRNYLEVYRGTGGGNFTYMNTTWGNINNDAEASVDNAFTFGDIDRDGDLDIMGWYVPWVGNDVNRQFLLYRNDLPAKNWINVRPVGLAGNKGAAGAKIRVFQPGTTTLLWYEEVLTYCKQAQQGYGYYYAQTERHYGLGTRTSVDIEVEFYPAGTKVKKSGAANNKTWIINQDGSTSELPVEIQKAEGERLKAEEIQLEASPNPFKAQTTLTYSARRTSDIVKMQIFDCTGKLVSTLANQVTGPGSHTVIWNAKNRNSGVYLARLTASGKVYTRQLLLMK